MHIQSQMLRYPHTSPSQQTISEMPDLSESEKNPSYVGNENSCGCMPRWASDSEECGAERASQFKSFNSSVFTEYLKQVVAYFTK